MIITGKVIGGDAAVATLGKVSVNVLARAKATVREYTFRIMRRVIDVKLEGDGSGSTLRRQSGNLARSVPRGTGVVEIGGVIIGTVGLGEADIKVAKYGAVHEYGFSGDVVVNPFTRKNGAMVRGFNRKVHMRERKMFRAALKEMTPEYIQALNKSIAQGVKDSK